MCLLEGQSLRPELPGHCTEKCSLYLSVCVPIVFDGLLDGCECSGDSYCEECPYYDECGMQKGAFDERFSITTNGAGTGKVPRISGIWKDNCERDAG